MTKLTEMCGAEPGPWLAAHRQDLLELVRTLVSFRSENRPPGGEEGPCQEFVAAYLGGLDLAADVFTPDEVHGAVEHPAWWPGRDYSGRPNVAARLAGAGGGRSLLFTGHVDVVPALGIGEYGYWDGAVVGGRLYGRGSLDMKGGIACYLHALRCLVECGLRLAGDVLVETTVDEEFGGANGTLACRLRGHHADAAVLPEPTGLTVCHATRGGIQYRIRASSTKGGMQFGAGAISGALATIARISVVLDDAGRNRGAPIYQYLIQSGEELPWGTAEGTPASGVLEFWAEILPGTAREDLEDELRDTVARASASDGVSLEWEQRTRFLPPAESEPDAPIMTAMSAALGNPGARPQTAPFACDAFMFAEHVPTPVVICGPGGDNPHAPDEYVLLDDLHTLADAYVKLALDWCRRP